MEFASSAFILYTHYFQQASWLRDPVRGYLVIKSTNARKTAL